MRALLAAMALTVLAGCTSVERLGSDGFYPGGVTAERFGADTAACQVQADNYLAYDLKAQGGTRYDQNRLFNATYGRCMRVLGYRPRSYVQNLLP